MSDQPAPANPAPAHPLHAALMHAGMTTEQADGVVQALADYVDTLVGSHWLRDHPAKPKKKKRKAKAKKRKR